MLIKPFIREVLKKRVPVNYLENDELIELSEESGLLGNLETFEYQLYNNYTGDKETASWLISMEFADKWSVFVSK